MRPPTPAFGNCFWEAVLDLCKVQNIFLPNGIKTAHELRVTVIGQLRESELFPTWLGVNFAGIIEDFEEFEKEQVKDGKYTDLGGVCVVAALSLSNQKSVQFLPTHLALLSPTGP